ncbi:DUF4224 domain-containing protein [Microbulbifer sp. JSM ZJ756]|uniref:DUF4224 domain-containing protein n=1 Tax=Microbulbifer sp. JSM ZJ756 TaxID=3376191 RepID=UPI00379B3069
MSTLVTKAELVRLTGANTPEAQKQVLDANRIPYVRRRDGQLSLTWDMVNQAALARINSTPAANGANLPPGFKLPEAS